MYRDHTDLSDLPAYERERLEWFFEDYKDTMSDVKVSQLSGAEDARKVILECMERYREHFEHDPADGLEDDLAATEIPDLGCATLNCAAF